MTNNRDSIEKEEEVEEEQQYVTFEEFSKVQLKIGKVIQSGVIPGMKKVFKATIDLGNEQRELAVGGAQYYKPEEFVGRVVVVCTNLQPKKIGNIISRGMLLAADGQDGKPIFLTINEDTSLGASIH
ncbi:MAG: methionine--tRNA ligase [Thermoproteota archaeon]|nr:methionine--tRNA ligase [Thermoproteota archaeon]